MRQNDVGLIQNAEEQPITLNISPAQKTQQIVPSFQVFQPSSSQNEAPKSARKTIEENKDANQPGTEENKENNVNTLAVFSSEENDEHRSSPNTTGKGKDVGSPPKIKKNEDNGINSAKNGTKRLFKRKWMLLFPWMDVYKNENKLRYEDVGYEEEDSITISCPICKTYNPVTKFGKEGSNQLKKAVFEKHAKSEAHQKGCQNKIEAQRLKNALLNFKTKAHLEVHSLMKIVAYLIENNRPNSDFSELIKLNQDLGAPHIKTNLYHNWYGFEEIVKSMKESIRINLFKLIQQSQYFSISIDESTDRVMDSHLIIYAHFIKQETFEYRARFLGLIPLKEKTGENIFNCIEEFINNHGLNMSRIIGFASDGASNMVGTEKGVSTRIKDLNPYLFQNHCICHRLHLTIKDTDSSIGDIMNLNDTLRKLYNFLAKSSKKLLELKEYEKIREEKQLKILRFFDIRWLSKFNCVNNLRQIYGSVLDLLAYHKNP